MFGNGKNRYTCVKCGGQVVTEDRDEGVTPFMIGCKAKIACTGLMRSACYRDVGADESVAFIWRKPTAREYAKAHPAMKEHFDRGGLDIYPNPVLAQSTKHEKP